MIRVDFHTHSTASPDGGISADEYRQLLRDSLDCVAITDHNTIELAVELHRELSNKIIVGEEIMTQQGEVIGLFLKQVVPDGLSLAEAIKAIKAQGGLVYLPHPFETVRKGVQKKDLESLADQIDIVETYNGRAVTGDRGPKAAVWARTRGKVGAASSDAHGLKGVGTAFTTIDQMPTAKTLVGQLATAKLTTQRPPLHSLLYPKLHRFRKKLKRGKV